VRGLEEREGTGDTGHQASVELMTPRILDGLRALAFVDAGRARMHNPVAGTEARQGASSAGLGLRYQARGVSLSVDWANVLNGTGTTARGDHRVQFAATIRF
jgi:hemolysin activation/secretion protein